MKLKPWKAYTEEVDKTRPARMKWWNDARYGMFVHFGTYSLLGRNEWAQGFECIPADEYDKLADDFDVLMLMRPDSQDGRYFLFDGIRNDFTTT